MKISGQVQFYTENVFKKNNNKNTQMVLSIHIYPVADCVPVNEFPKLIENGIFTEKQHKILISTPQYYEYYGKAKKSCP